MKRMFLMMGACLALTLTACDDTENDGKKALSESLKKAAAALDASMAEQYKTVDIAGQTWMAENLNIETPNSYCNQPDNCKANGRLYTWDAAQTVCPAGWHLPSESEARVMLDGVSDFRTAFNAKAIGFRKDNGEFLFEDLYEYFWTSEGKKDKASYWYWTSKDNSVKWLMGMKSSALSVRCVKGDVMVDERDGKKYRIVKIGSQTWMAENVNYRTRDSFCFKDNESNCKKYGRLYKRSAARKACPSGWHLPSKVEFETLFESVGGKLVAGRNLRSKNGWIEGKNLGTDAFEFSALPAGYRNAEGYFSSVFNSAEFWSSTEDSSDDAYFMELMFDKDFAGLYINENHAFSVRCLKDDGVTESAIEESKDVYDENSFAGTLIDKRDNKKYRTVKIDNQTWMAENLNYKTKDSYCYDDSESNCKTYGRLYKWQATLKACPEGWHLPGKSEFEALFNSVGGASTAGEVLKSKFGWSISGNGTDAFGFSALPAGYKYYYSGNYGVKSVNAYFWSSTESGSDDAYYMYLYHGYGAAYLGDGNKGNGNSVRCLKD